MALHEGRDANVMCGGLVRCGDAQAALGKQQSQSKGTFKSGFVEHAYIEPEAGFARMVGDRIGNPRLAPKHP